MAHVSDIKLIRTDTTLDLSQKAEKGMIWPADSISFYKCSSRDSALLHRCGIVSSTLLFNSPVELISEDMQPLVSKAFLKVTASA
ncbi:hypothetical protein SADUNF_Sadunf16G0071000 [Salix dunnii]|uniref:Uncharacterized protein n=1 Tax=Salix dunnii TaxID=1413687 RepID=A0A835MPK1_9ROSI|nr:hypothetical protein SADUNF_Sadunf16G0071000 [Salix dunnii]